MICARFRYVGQGTIDDAKALLKSYAEITRFIFSEKNKVFEIRGAEADVLYLAAATLGREFKFIDKYTITR
jgi:hypothetical protein